MGKPAAKKGDTIVSTDIHLVQIPTPTGPVTVPLPHPFKGELTTGLSNNVNVMGKPAATKGSGGENKPKHVALGIKFLKNPTNKGTVFMGSFTVKINGKQAARSGDMVMTCNDPTDLPIGKIIASGTVMIG
ncbi:MAG: PAAR domain-containing protein [Flavobacteriales bacterium]|nr:PAAR domain-containing protein [Flavobacteriales bacterium]